MKVVEEFADPGGCRRHGGDLGKEPASSFHVHKLLPRRGCCEILKHCGNIRTRPYQMTGNAFAFRIILSLVTKGTPRSSAVAPIILSIGSRG